MPRVIPPDLLTRVSEPVTSRRWLLSMEYSTPIKFYSGHDSIGYGGYIWGSFPFEVKRLKFDDMGRGSADIIFSNLDQTLSALFLGPEGVTGIEASIYYYDSGEAELMLQGYLDGADIHRQAIVRIKTENDVARTAPRLTANPPLNNWITPDGTIICWGNERLIVRRRR